MHSGHITLNGITSPALRSGDQNLSTAIVFVHGNPGSCQDWADLVETAGSFSRCIAIDMPGFGQAGKPDSFNYSIDGYVAHLQALIEFEKIDKVHLVLHDLGGPWGLHWAKNHPDKLASITLLNTGINIGYRWHYMARIWRTPILGEISMAITTRWSMKQALKHGNPRGLPDAYFDEIYRNYDRATRKAVLKMYRSADNLGYEVLAAKLAPSQIPTLVVWGAADPYVPVKYAEMQREYFAVERVVILPDSGHWPMIDNRPAVRDAVIPFIKKQMEPLTVV